MTRVNGAREARFPKHVAKASKRRVGAAASIEKTPLHVRAQGVGIDAQTKAWIEDRAARRLGRYAPRIERLTFRFVDINGPRGGKDTSCRGRALLFGLPTVVVEKRARNARAAFDLTSSQLARAVAKSSSPRATKSTKSKPATPRATKKTEPELLIGRREGQHRKNLLRAAERPEKKRRDAIVDTALPGVSASDRKVGLRGTATRNTKLNRRGMVAALEDSATGRPSRKSTRRSANRLKSGSKLGRKTQRALRSPQQKARRAAARAR